MPWGLAFLSFILPINIIDVVEEYRMADRLDDLFRFNQRALALRAERQQVLASNIANADTPNYKARDFDFRKALQAAVGNAQAGTQAVTPAATHPAHLGAPVTSGGVAVKTASGQPLLYRIPRQDSIDGNTVELDAERAEFADNALRYEVSLSDVNGKIKGLLAAIQGQ